MRSALRDCLKRSSESNRFHSKNCLFLRDTTNRALVKRSTLLKKILMRILPFSSKRHLVLVVAILQFYLKKQINFGEQHLHTSLLYDRKQQDCLEWRYYFRIRKLRIC